MTGELIGVREAARRLHIHENSVRNWHKWGLLHAVQASPRYVKFTAAEVARVRELLDAQPGLNHLARTRLLREAPAPWEEPDQADGHLDGSVVGVLVRLRLPRGMTPREAVREVAKGVRFGKPEITLHFVTDDRREDG